MLHHGTYICALMCILHERLVSGCWHALDRVTRGSKRLLDGVLERTVPWFAPRVGHGFMKLGVSLHVYVDVFG